jgi:anti-sigma regulatory factor (Ser/Thr protein kinase)
MRSTDELERVRLAVTEACANAVRHAYPEGGGVLDVRVLVDAAEVVIEVRDMGIGLRLHPPVPAKPGITRLGLDLIHALADVVEIHDLGPGTSVKMTFRPR